MSFESTVDVLTWICGCAQILAMIFLFCSIWYNKHCSGISLKSQVLHTFVITVLSVQSIFLVSTSDKRIVLCITILASLVLPYGILISLLVFRKDCLHQTQYDKARIEFLILPCIVIAIATSVYIYYPLGFSIVLIAQIFWQFIAYLTVVSIIPQFLFVIKAQKIQPCVLFYIVTVGFYQTLLLVNSFHDYDMRKHSILRIATNLVRTSTFCVFYFYIIGSGLCCRSKYQQVERTATQDHVESGIPDTDHLANNANTVVFKPDSLSEIDNNKTDLLKDEKSVKKY